MAIFGEENGMDGLRLKIAVEAGDQECTWCRSGNTWTCVHQLRVNSDEFSKQLKLEIRVKSGASWVLMQSATKILSWIRTVSYNKWLLSFSFSGLGLKKRPGDRTHVQVTEPMFRWPGRVPTFNEPISTLWPSINALCSPDWGAGHISSMGMWSTSRAKLADISNQVYEDEVQFSCETGLSSS